MKPTLSALAVLSTISGGVTADEMERHDAEMDVIVVQGQKIARSIQETKESVAVLTDGDIEQYEIRDLNEAFAVTANVYDMGSGEVFGIRGVTQNQASTGGGTGEMGSLYVDGVAYTGYASRFMNKDVWDVEQIEVLRGPQSTNVGRNALIGAVVVNTKRPELEYFDAAMRLGAGSYGRENLDAMINAPIGDNAAFRLTGQLHESDGFIQSDVFDTDRYDARTNNNLRGQVLFEPSDKWNLNLLVQYAETVRGQDIYFVDPENGFKEDSRKSFDNVKADEAYDGFTAAIDFTYYLTPTWTLNSLTSYLDGEYRRIDDGDRQPDVFGNQVEREVEDKNIAQELRFNYQGDRTKGVVGFYFTQVEEDIKTDRLANYGLHAIISSSLTGTQAEAAIPQLLALYPEIVQVDEQIAYEKTKQNFAFFTEWDYELSRDWSASAGVRYDYEKSKIAPSTQSRIPVGGLSLPLSPGGGIGQIITMVNQDINKKIGVVSQPQLDTSYSALLPQFGLTYKFSEDIAISALYKRGYRSGGTDIDTNGNARKFEPEYLDNFELATRAVWLDGDLTTNANFYYGSWKDQQVEVCIGITETNCYTENAGKSEIYGFEFDMEYYVSQDLSTFANVGLARTEFIDYVTGKDNEDLSGNQFAYSPEITAAVGLNYFITNRLYSTVSANYLDEMYSDFSNSEEYKTDARTIYNITTGYIGDNFKLDAYIKNLTDESYIQGNYFNDTLDYRSVRMGAPREFGVNLTVFM